MELDPREQQQDLQQDQDEDHQQQQDLQQDQDSNEQEQQQKQGSDDTVPCHAACVLGQYPGACATPAIEFAVQVIQKRRYAMMMTAEEVVILTFS